MDNGITFIIESIEGLCPVVEALIERMKEQKIWVFVGEMGAGKTTLIKVLCEQLGVFAETVNSPTFSIVNEYETRDQQIIYHFDFYRMEKESEAFDMGYEEYFYSGNLCLIEWPQKIASLIPDTCGLVRIDLQNETTRKVTITIE